MSFMSNFTVENIYHTVKGKSVLLGLKSESQSILKLGKSFGDLTDEQLQAQFQSLGTAKTDRPMAFALIYQAAVRALGIHPHLVQITGALALQGGFLAEMHTGEGKTLVVAMSAAYSALARKGVHVVTVNEYLATRDQGIMRGLFELLGLSSDTTLANKSTSEKQQAYRADITYGMNSEFGFDYLRDNMAVRLEDKVQRELYFAMIDEVDSILIDECRTPLIVSASGQIDTQMYFTVDQAVRGLKAGEDFHVQEKDKQILLTEQGYERVESSLVALGAMANAADLYQPEYLPLLNQLPFALRAHILMKRDVDYVIKNGEVCIIDPSTGRVMDGRRWGQGLHQAVEAKEQVQIKPDAETRASIIYQTFFKMYQRLCGLTGTAATESEEFATVYGLQVVQIPTNKPVARLDENDLIFRTKAAKREYLVRHVKATQLKGQPVLVGTADVKESEILSRLFAANGIEHEVLNAKNHAREADIIAEAGKPGAVTIATNMAGRGTDIQLGGHAPKAGSAEFESWQQARDAVLRLGGLRVIGSERAESRRIDNQLKGRAGRQGDLGSSVFFLSLEDDLLRVFGHGKLQKLFDLLVSPDTDSIQSESINKLVTSAQIKLEQRGQEARKQLTKYDQAISEQRSVVYRLRDALLSGEMDALEYAHELAWQYCESNVLSPEALRREQIALHQYAKDLKLQLKQEFGLSLPVLGWASKESVSFQQECADALCQRIDQKALSTEQLRTRLLAAVDRMWVDHLTVLSELQKNSSLSSLAGKNPTMIFKERAFEAFKSFKPAVGSWFLTQIFADELGQLKPNPATPDEIVSSKNEAVQAFVAKRKVEKELEARWVARTEMCPCGSGMRYKNCHGQVL